MRIVIVLLMTALVLLPGVAGAVNALPFVLYAGEHFSFAVPQGWTETEQDGMIYFEPKEDNSYFGAILTVEEVDVRAYAPFTAEELYQGIAAGLSDHENPVCEQVVIDGHSAALVELADDTGCLCTVLYCRGVTLLAISVTTPEKDTHAARPLVLNIARYTAYLGS